MYLEDYCNNRNALVECFNVSHTYTKFWKLNYNKLNLENEAKVNDTYIINNRPFFIQTT